MSGEAMLEGAAAMGDELEKLEEQLAERELQLATLQGELDRFQELYSSTVGGLIAELDSVQAELAELLAKRQPDNEASQCRAREAQARARQSAGAAGVGERRRDGTAFHPSDQLKRLYRTLAKRIHPDLAIDGRDRARREELMKEANEAYRAGDEGRLRAMLAEIMAPPPFAAAAQGMGGSLVSARIRQVRLRLSGIDKELAALRAGDLCTLMRRVSAAAEEGRDLLRDMARALASEIAEARTQLAAFQSE
jgi:DNA repair exonuclease SbcCD ATPase subunit